MLKLEQEKQESSAIIADLKRIKEQQERDLSELRESASKRVDDTQKEDIKVIEAELQTLKENFNRAVQDNNEKMAAHEKELRQRDQDIHILNDELLQLRKTLLDKDKEMKQVGDEKKKVLEQLECSFADMVAQRNGYELKLQTLKDKIENPSQGKRSSILLQKKGVDKENLDINNIDSDPVRIRSIFFEINLIFGRISAGNVYHIVIH